MIDPTLVIGELIDGRWRLLRAIGAGAFGWVFETERVDFDTGPAAIKVIRPQGADASERALAEFRIVAQLNHDHLLAYLDSGRVNEGPLAGSLYLVTELCDGPLDKDPGFGHPGFYGPKLAEVVSQTAAALEYLHGRRIVHRDVKPSNILLKDGMAKLADLGLARAVAETHGTTPSGTKGTFRFMAPELFGSEQAAIVGPPADIWALGISAHLALSGTFPYEDGDDNHYIAKLIARQPIAIAPTVPAAWCDFIERCCDLEPARRPSAAELPALVPNGSANFAQGPGMATLVPDQQPPAAAPTPFHAPTPVPTSAGGSFSDTTPEWAPWLVGSLVVLFMAVGGWFAGTQLAGDGGGGLTVPTTPTGTISTVSPTTGPTPVTTVPTTTPPAPTTVPATTLPVPATTIPPTLPTFEDPPPTTTPPDTTSPPTTTDPLTADWLTVVDDENAIRLLVPPEWNDLDLAGLYEEPLLFPAIRASSNLDNFANGTPEGYLAGGVDVTYFPDSADAFDVDGVLDQIDLEADNPNCNDVSSRSGAIVGTAFLGKQQALEQCGPDGTTFRWFLVGQHAQTKAIVVMILQMTSVEEIEWGIPIAQSFQALTS